MVRLRALTNIKKLNIRMGEIFSHPYNSKCRKLIDSGKVEIVAEIRNRMINPKIRPVI
jgi:hypothetical protein